MLLLGKIVEVVGLAFAPTLLAGVRDCARGD